MTTINVELPPRSYKIFLQNGLLKNFAEIQGLLSNNLNKVKSFAIVTDKNVSALYEKTVAESLRSAGFNVVSYAIEPGEASKCAAQYFALQSRLAENQITRSDALIALGGGVVGDLTGFVAATYLRGIPFIQVPTTLLAMVDSSVGGKTGIDIPQGKNLVGAFYQPSAVICDPQVLSTLTPEVFSDGCAEVVKHAMIRSEKLLKLLREAPIHSHLPEIIEENIKIKRDIVQRDEFDTGERLLLNFGHTIGHAIEKLSDFKISHGQAVATGMRIITRAAVIRAACTKECEIVLDELLEKFNLLSGFEADAEGVFTLNRRYSPKAIFDAALTDKKREGNTITEIIPVKPGVCELYKMPVSELLEWIEVGMK